MNFDCVKMAYLELLEEVNNAKTRSEHHEYECKIIGFLECSRALGFTGLSTIGDLHYLTQGVDRPMCGGIWLDWEPEATDVCVAHDKKEN